MVTATKLRSLLLDSAVNPKEDRLVAGIVDIATADYLHVRAIELLRQNLDVLRSSRGEDQLPDGHVDRNLIEVITLLGLARAKNDGTTTEVKRKTRS